MVWSEADFERLPEEGLWEVVDGRAILLPPNDVEHQFISDALGRMLWPQLERHKCGFAVSTPNVFIPRKKDALGRFQNRVPDVAVFKRQPKRHFEVGNPPELVIEILATRRGNVERTEKMDDYALAGIAEYWIVNPFDKVVEMYSLRGGEYVSKGSASTGVISPDDFPGVRIDVPSLWVAY